LRPEQVTDAVTDANVGYAVADCFDHADRIGTQAVRQRQRIASCGSRCR